MAKKLKIAKCLEIPLLQSHDQPTGHGSRAKNRPFAPCFWNGQIHGSALWTHEQVLHLGHDLDGQFGVLYLYLFIQKMGFVLMQNSTAIGTTVRRWIDEY